MDRRSFIASAFAAVAAPGALLQEQITLKGLPLVSTPLLTSWKNWTFTYEDVEGCFWKPPSDEPYGIAYWIEGK